MNTAFPAIFLADSSGLDFLNTIATPVDTPVDWISHGTGLLRWLREAGLVPTATLDRMEKEATPKALDAVAQQARELREWLRSFVLKHKGRPLSVRNARELEPLNALLRQDQSYHQLVVEKAGVSMEAQRRWPSPESLLIPIADAIAHMISEEDFTHIKACEGHACTLIFADHTRARGRRWCSMGICGNRAKVSAHRKRQQAAQ
ncbi:MAG TPA: ABATE domain-containing protein [Bryobacteraceae bacterium]